jgi:glycosyltransferase involved in cell wall biosynthesis
VHYVHAADRTPVHGSLLRRFYERTKRRRNVRNEAVAFRNSRLIIADSDTTRRDVIALHGASPVKVVRVYYGIDSDVFCAVKPEERALAESELKLPQGRRRCLFVGALADRRKGLDTLLGAWRVLKRSGAWDVDLLVVGAGRSSDIYHQQTERWEMTDSVRFLGFRSDVSRILRVVDCFVAPTRYEPYGLAVQEAICVGVPAIVSESAGVSERYPEGLRGLLLRNPDDPLELAERLRAWKTDEAWYRASFKDFGCDLRRRSWDDMADEILELVRPRAHEI